MDGPSIIERAGIRTRRDTHDDGERVKAEVTGSGAIISMTIAQAHELIDQLAMQVGRPDLVAAHKFVPQKRVQPGGSR